MNAQELLEKLSTMPEESRGSFSAAILTLSKLGAAEAAHTMLRDNNFAVRINALKAIRKHNLDTYEKEIISLLLDNDTEVRLAAVKTLSSFGNAKHFELIKTFFIQNPESQGLLADIFINFSDIYDSYELMMGQILSPHEKVRESVGDWFAKAFNHDILLPWILQAYNNSSFNIKRAFEITFAPFLPKLFGDKKHGYRFKLVYVLEKVGNDF